MAGLKALKTIKEKTSERVGDGTFPATQGIGFVRIFGIMRRRPSESQPIKQEILVILECETTRVQVYREENGFVCTFDIQV